MEPAIGNVKALPGNRFRWNIPNFEALPRDADYSVDSPPFSWGSATWCLRLYPNGVTSHALGCINLGLVIQQPRREAAERRRGLPQVIFKLEFMKSNKCCVHREIKLKGSFRECNTVVLGPLRDLTRDAALLECRRTNSEVRFSMEFIVGDVRTISQNSFIWHFPNFDALPQDADYSVDSPPFRWGDAMWYLRLYPNGFRRNVPRCINLGLVTQQPPREGQKDECKLGIMKRDSHYDHRARKLSGYFSKSKTEFLGPLSNMTRDAALLACSTKNYAVRFSCTIAPRRKHA